MPVVRLTESVLSVLVLSNCGKDGTSFGKWPPKPTKTETEVPIWEKETGQGRRGLLGGVS